MIFQMCLAVPGYKLRPCDRCGCIFSVRHYLGKFYCSNTCRYEGEHPQEFLPGGKRVS